MKKILFLIMMILSMGGYAQSITEVIYPQFVQGVGSSNASDDRKVPFACRMTVNGLLPSSTYRYYNKFVADPTLATNGQGNYILATQSGDFIRVTSATLAVAGRYGEFTTDANGTYTGWYIIEPSLALEFQPGTLLYFRLLLNNGAGGGSVATRVTSTNPVTVLGWGASASQGTGLRAPANAAYTPKNFMMFYNNLTGTGRPLSGTFIESDGTDNNASTSGYAPFYANSVDAVANTWGTIIPNNLANGVNNLSQYSLSSGALINRCTAANGVYGSTNTANANGGLTELVLSCTPVPVGPTCNVTASISGTNVLCNGASTGAANLTVTGATAPVAYAWSNGTTTEDLTGIPAGTYSVLVTDANSCTATANVTITQPTALVAASIAGTIACNGGTTTVTVSATGGTAPYTGTGSFTRGAGSYTYTVTDANGCTSVTTGNIAQPALLTASAQAGTIACNGGTTNIVVTAAGGTAPYTGTGTFSRSAGAYSFTVTDANGCTAVASGTINQPTALVAASQAGIIACNGGTTTVTVSATGGTAPYTGTGTFTRSAGAYTFTVTDANGCTSVTTGTIAQPAALVATSQSGIIACNGGTTTVTVSATGGTAPYTGTGTFTRSAGAYTYTVTDANGCTAVTTGTIAQPAVLTTSAQAGTILCNGGTATVTVSATGGTAPYTGTGSFTRSAGAYSFTVTDSRGCTAVVSGSISQPTALVASSTAGTIIVPGGTTTVTVSATGGTAPYTGTGTFTRGAGAYSYTVTDANGCTSVTTGTISQPGSVLTAASTFTAIACNGGTSTVTVTATGGTAPYTGTGNFTRSAGAYSFTVTDANGVTAVTTGNISQPAALIASSQAGIIACNGGTTSVTVSATGGTAPYTGTGSFTRSAGAYTFTVTDANGCTSVTSGTIAQPAVLAASAQAGTILCNGGTTTVTVSATGGTAPYTGTGSFTRSAGAYSFTVTDSRGCTAVVSGSISQPTALVASSTAGTIIVPGGTTTVTVSATGGTAPYTGTGTFTRSAGAYSFTVTDANGCTSVTTGTISQPGSVLTAASTFTAIACNGGTSTVTVTATGGTAPYTGTGNFTRSAGAYSFTVTDANGVTAVTTGNISQPAALIASSQAGIIACNGGTTTVNVSATGGTAPYTGTGSFTRSAGAYTFTVTDANGCTSVTTGTIAQPAVLAASAQAGTILCNGGTTTVTVSATGGTAPYTGTGNFTRSAGAYSFTVTDSRGCTAVVSGSISQPTALVASSTAGTIIVPGGTTTVTVSATGGTAPYTGTGTFTRGAGAYSYTVTDANGCTSVTSGTIAEPGIALSAASTFTAIACNGGTSTVTVTATGGTAPYTGTGTFTRSAGAYSFTVTDATGATATTTGTISQPAALVASSQAGIIACNGGTTTVTVSASGGTAPYTGTGTFTRSAGAYTYTVTDANGCTAVTTGTIAQPAVLTASAQAGTIACNGGTTTVTVSATGGTAPYTGTGSFTRSAGAYSFTVTDSRGCTAVVSGTISQPTALVASSTAGTIIVPGGTTTVTVSATGGTAPYTGTGTFTRGAGAYSYTVTDANGCTSVTSGTIAEPGIALSAASTFTAIACNGGISTVTVTATGGTAPYTGTGNFTRSAGAYSFTVTDATGATATTTGTISQPAALVASSQAGIIACNGGTTTVTVSATGGTAPYSGTGTFTRSAGAYTYTVTDAKGCTAVTTGTITAPTAVSCLIAVSPNPTITGGAANTIYIGQGPQSVTLAVTGAGGTAPYTYSWSNGLGTGNSKVVSPTTTTTYTVTTTDSKGCTSTCSVTINVVPPTNGCSTNPVSCRLSVATHCPTGTDVNTIYIGYGQQSKVLKAIGSGGVAPYTYIWSGGSSYYGISNQRVVSPTQTTTYTVTIRDTRGCTSTCSITIKVVDVRCGSRNDKVLVCVNPNSSCRQTLCVSKHQVASYLSCGAILGSCSNICTSCKGTSAEEVIEMSDKAVSLNVFPNPATQFIKVEWKAGTEEIAVVKVIDLNGKILINKQFSGLIKNVNNIRRLDLAGIRSGAYVLQVISGSVSTTKRFTIL